MSFEALISDSSRGDERAFRSLYSHLADRVFKFIRSRTANRDDALDITQDTFTDLWRALSKAGSRFEYQGESQLVAFIYTIASRKLARYYRFRRVHVSLEDIADIVPDETEFGHSQEMADVAAAVSKMSKNDQEIIQFRYIAGLPFAEIAELTGESENTLKVRHHRAIARLRNLLEKTSRLENEQYGKQR